MNVAFLLTSLVIVALPGTGALITLSAGLSHGARASVVAALGCTLGIVPHLVAAVTGTAALLRASGVAFDALRIAGVLYLLVMAVATWRDESALVIDEDQSPRSSAQVIGSAMFSNLLNPKLTVFFFAFLPQFVPPHAAHQVPRLLALSGVFMAMTFVVFVIYGVSASTSPPRHRTPAGHPARASSLRGVVRRPRGQTRDNLTLSAGPWAAGARPAPVLSRLEWLRASPDTQPGTPRRRAAG